MIRFKEMVLTCERCGGTGEFREVTSGPMHRSEQFGPCGSCNGVGSVLTRQGEELRKFVDFLSANRYKDLRSASS